MGAGDGLRAIHQALPQINLIHPQVSGEVEVSKVVSKTNDSGFIRTYIYF